MTPRQTGPTVSGAAAQVLGAGERDVGDLGRPVEVVDHVAEDVERPRRQRAGQLGAADEDPLERGEIPLRALIDRVEDPREHHGNEDDAGRTGALDVVEDADRVEAAPQDRGRGHADRQRHVGEAERVE